MPGGALGEGTLTRDGGASGNIYRYEALDHGTAGEARLASQPESHNDSQPLSKFGQRQLLL